jgi:hypothetical protein
MLQYLLPALIPSWRFFDSIAPSPRIEFALVARSDDAVAHWQEFRPHPAHVSGVSMLRSLLWNPRWNESLYMVSCAEKIIDEPSAMRENELVRRIAEAIQRSEVTRSFTQAMFLTIRVIVLQRQAGQITRQVRFVSESYRLADAQQWKTP